jgi:predicted short-subunit dehydrogenase-like oxidoreductase (DUF2520 family)
MMAFPAVRPEQRPGRLTIGVLGAGRTGSALAAALTRAGHRVVAATPSSRPYPLLGDVPRMPADEVAARSQLLLLTVPDDALDGLARGLASTGAVRPGQLVVHASGVHGLAVLSPIAQAGALPLALHPAMTFTGEDTDLDRLPGTTVAVTTPDALRPAGEVLVLEIGGEPVWVPEALRPLWHAGLTHGANHLVTLVGQTVDLLRRAGVESPEHVLAPLLTAALEGALRSGDAALTGPVVRGDARTVAAHLQVLVGDPARASYLTLARATADRALDAGRLRAADAEGLLEVLGEVTR